MSSRRASTSPLLLALRGGDVFVAGDDLRRDRRGVRQHLGRHQRRQLVLGQEAHRFLLASMGSAPIHGFCMPLLFRIGVDRGPGEKCDQGLGRRAVLGGRTDAPGIDGRILYLGRQRASQRHALDGHDLADLVDGDFGFPAGDQLGDIAARLELGLRPHLIGDAQPIQQLVEIDAARAAGLGIDVGDRFRGQQRALEGIDRADVGQRRRPP